MTFKRDNTKNKKLYYRSYVVIELIILVSLYYFGVHWFILLFMTPMVLLDMWSNIRCANRQKKYISEIEISKQGIICSLANGRTEKISIEKCLFSIREQKFEKDKTEIEIRRKRLLKSLLIGRIHIKNWAQIFEIKEELIKNSIAQIKYRPEGYWSKYGTLTADVAITLTVLTVAEAAQISGNAGLASDIGSDVFMPITEIKETLKIDQDKK